MNSEVSRSLNASKMAASILKGRGEGGQGEGQASDTAHGLGHVAWPWLSWLLPHFGIPTGGERGGPM